MGRAIGLVLMRLNHDLIFSAHGSRAALEQTAEDLAGFGGCARVLDADLRQPRACHALVEQAATWRGRLDVLVCLASVFEQVDVGALTPDVWRAHLGVDLDASFHCAQAAAAAMRPNRRGHIVLSSDWVAASGRPRYRGYAAYYVAKAGVVALTQALAVELAPDGIQVNAVAPGPILPAAGATRQQQDAVIAATPLGRWGTPDAIAETIGGLVDGSCVTGEVIRVDGGRHLV